MGGGKVVVVDATTTLDVGSDGVGVAGLWRATVPNSIVEPRSGAAPSTRTPASSHPAMRTAGTNMIATSLT